LYFCGSRVTRSCALPDSPRSRSRSRRQCISKTRRTLHQVARLGALQRACIGRKVAFHATAVLTTTVRTLIHANAGRRIRRSTDACQRAIAVPPAATLTAAKNCPGGSSQRLKRCAKRFGGGPDWSNKAPIVMCMSATRALLYARQLNLLASRSSPPRAASQPSAFGVDVISRGAARSRLCTVAPPEPWSPNHVDGGPCDEWGSLAQNPAGNAFPFISVSAR
jgi:hypothetical protein